jgi:hypothetical protein
VTDQGFGLPITDVNSAESFLTQQYARGQMSMTDNEQLERLLPTGTEIASELADLNLAPLPGIMRCSSEPRGGSTKAPEFDGVGLEVTGCTSEL